MLSGGYDILYRAKLDGARPCGAFDIRYARMGILYRAKLDGARPPEGHAIRYARMGIPGIAGVKVHIGDCEQRKG